MRKRSVALNFPFLRSVSALLDRFQMHLRTSSPCRVGRPLWLVVGVNGRTMSFSKSNSALQVTSAPSRSCDVDKIYLLEQDDLITGGKQTQDSHVDEFRHLLVFILGEQQ
jgi:hypothetical protein